MLIHRIIILVPVDIIQIIEVHVNPTVIIFGRSIVRCRGRGLVRDIFNVQQTFSQFLRNVVDWLAGQLEGQGTGDANRE